MSSTYLITAPTFHGKRLFTNERFGEVFTGILMRFRQDSGFQLHDYVFMPDHVHLLLSIPSAGDVTTVVLGLQHAFVEELRREYNYNGEIWEAHFECQPVENAAHYQEAARHIHSNPVRVGFCKEPGVYRMSSVAARYVLDPLPEKLRTAQPA